MSIPRQKKEMSFQDPDKKRKPYFDLGWFIVVMVFEILVITTTNQIINDPSYLLFALIVAVITSLIISTIARHCYGDLSSRKDN